MFGTWTYLIWLGLFIGLPLIGLAIWGGRVWWRDRRALAWTFVGATVGGWSWDYAAIQLGFWSFEGGHQIGVEFLGLPLEEWLWILGVAWMFAGLALILKARRCGDPGAAPATEPASEPPTYPGLVAAVALVQFSQLGMLATAGLVFHALLWTRNAAFLRAELRTLAEVTGVAVLWLLASDPVGAAWGAWDYDPDRVLGIWIFGLIPAEDVLGVIFVSSAAAASALVFAWSPRRWI